MAADPQHHRPDRAATGRDARAFFEDLWSKGDPWDLDISALDQERYARQLRLLDDRRYPRALELGCAAGSFTRLLAPLCDRLLAVDISEQAIAGARAAGTETGPVELQVANIMEIDPAAGGPWDLVVLAETAYYLGWLYPMFDIGWLAHTLREATAPGGRLLLVNTFGRDTGIMSQWLIRSYRDLFVNAGYEIEVEETLEGVKETVHFEVLLTRLRRP